jgi:hypothetical protein
MGVLDEHGWESIIRLRYERTAPTVGKRKTAAVKESYLEEVEACNTHLADSQVADKLVWKDIVTFKFPINGMARSRGLMFPWPFLVQRVTKAGVDLTEVLQSLGTSIETREKDRQNLERVVQVLVETPMNVSLLQQSGIGKTLRKVLKTASKDCCQKAEGLGFFEKRQVSYLAKSPPISPSTQLEDLLGLWKDIAANQGVAMSSEPSSKLSNFCSDSDLADLQLAEDSCHSWRQLYHVLQTRESKRRANQGARMRESRERISRNQPKIVKVKHAKAKHEAILTGGFKNPAPCTVKMQAIRQESRVAVSWQKSSPAGVAKSPSTFSSAVAFASAGKKSPKHKLNPSTQTVSLGGGKHMKVPAKLSSTSLLKKKLQTRPLTRR